jgi:hypothetical protein
MAGRSSCLVAVVALCALEGARLGHMIIMRIQRIVFSLLGHSFKRFMAGKTCFSGCRGCGRTFAMAGNTFNPLFFVAIRQKILLFFLHGKKRSKHSYYSAKTKNSSKHRINSFLKRRVPPLNSIISLFKFRAILFHFQPNVFQYDDQT